MGNFSCAMTSSLVISDVVNRNFFLADQYEQKIKQDLIENAGYAS